MEPLRELRIALVLSGGASLAVWIGGVCDQLLRFVVAGRTLRSLRAKAGNQPLTPAQKKYIADDPYLAALHEASVYPTIDVMVGTSAGGINSVLLGLGINHRHSDLSAVRDLWLDVGALETLLRDPSDEMISILDGERFLKELREAIGRLAPDPATPNRDEPRSAIQLTGTHLQGRTAEIPVNGRDPIVDTTHDVIFRFDHNDLQAALAPGSDELQRLAIAARTTASFPFAFEPVEIETELFKDHATGLDLGQESQHVIDGGVWANLPAQQAIDAIMQQRSEGLVRRVVALVDPTPQRVETDETEPRTDASDPFDVVSAALLTIPRSQPISGFIETVESHNRRVLSTRSARSELFRNAAEPDASETLRATALALFPSYRARRFRDFASRLPLASRGLVDGPDQCPFIPRSLSTPDDGSWCWGSNPVIRMATTLVTALNSAYERGYIRPDQYELFTQWKREIFRDGLEDYRGAGAALLESTSEGAPDPLATWPLPAEQRNTGPNLRSKLNIKTRMLGRIAVELAELVPAIDDEAPSDLHGFAELIRSVPARPKPKKSEKKSEKKNKKKSDDERASWATEVLLALEVIESAFGDVRLGGDHLLDIVQVTPDQRVQLDPERRGADKLTGNELGNFGAFMESAWRANDWMWGRLDASEMIVDLLFERSIEELEAVGVPTNAHSDKNKERTEFHKRRVQDAVAHEEFRALRRELDTAERSDVGRKRARALSRALDADGDLADSRAAVRLASSIGRETTADLIGMGATSSTLIGVANNVTTALRESGPNLLRAVAASASTATSAAWRLDQALKKVKHSAALVSLWSIVLTLLFIASVYLSRNDPGEWFGPLTGTIEALILSTATLALIGFAVLLAAQAPTPFFAYVVLAGTTAVVYSNRLDEWYPRGLLIAAGVLAFLTFILNKDLGYLFRSSFRGLGRFGGTVVFALLIGGVVVSTRWQLLGSIMLAAVVPLLIGGVVVARVERVRVIDLREQTDAIATNDDLVELPGERLTAGARTNQGISPRGGRRR